MKILIWNVRGALKPSFRSSFGRLMQLHKCDICVLLETRLSGDSLAFVRRQISRSWSSYAIESEGLSGGILVLWRHADIKVDAFHLCGQQVALVISEGSLSPWLLSGVYASTDFRIRRALWAELHSLISQGIPALCAGDFNCIVEATEKRGGRQFVETAGILEFRSFIASANMLDLGFQGAQFTWCNNRNGAARVSERLDRVLATANWIQSFPSTTVTHLSRIASDHCPILINTEAVVQRRGQFKFEKFWTSYSAARSLISQVWRIPVRGNATYRLSRRLELARRRLIRWNREEVGDIVRQIEQLENTIETIQEKEDRDGGLLDSDLATLRSSLALHHSLLRQQEIYWRQRSRVQWIKEGDQNTRFFHQSTLKRRAANRISRLVDEEGNVQDNSEGIGDQLRQFFHSRWTALSGDGIPVCPVPTPLKVTVEENDDLTRPVSEEEIREALWNLGPDKAPGPDGFPPFFFRHYWSIVRQDVLQAIQVVFQTNSLPSDWNRTLIVLVPKRPDASKPQHFRPISLCSTLYKICARILVSRLRVVIPRIISPEQGAFLRGRCISDNVLLAQEVMHDLHRAPTRQCLMAIKMDMERAYDRVSREFLYRALQEFGFAEPFIAWIRACIQRPSFSIIINGGLTDYFSSDVGLRQGCPLSPFLFIIVADALSRALHQAQQDSAIVPYSAGPQGPSLCHLLFADDCILMGRATINNAAAFASVIQSYCRASGQKVNLDKSMICFSPKTGPSLRQAIQCTMGIFAQADRLSYLGVPITGRRPRCSDFLDLERRVRARIDGWQVTGLSMMARLTLIRSVLTSLPLYILSNTAVPVTCLRRMERWFRNFLWGSTQGGHGIHLVAWDVVCMPISEGGLGIQSLTVRREALTARHATRFLLDPDCLWSSFMRAKYGGWSTYTPPQPNRACSFFWKEVCHYASDMLSCISWMIGDGASVDVLRDTWVADLPLSRWPTFLSTDIVGGMRVSDLIVQDSSVWQVSRVATLFGPELSRRILSIPLIPDCASDIRLWRRSYSTRAPISDLIQEYRPQARTMMDNLWIWKLPIHHRVRLFIWKLAWDCLPTCSLLSNRGMMFQPRCPLCGLETETADHAIFTCDRARLVWQLAGYQFGNDNSGPCRLSFLRMIRQDGQGGTRQMRSSVAYIAHQVWLSRNKEIFSDVSTPPHKTLRTALSLSEEYMLHQSGLAADRPGIWDSPAAEAAHRHTVFVSWEPPPPGFVKVNFDGSVQSRLAGSAFVIRNPDGAMIAAGGFGSLDLSVPLAELYAAWAGISVAIRSLGSRYLIIEGDSSTVVRWIRQDCGDPEPTNPLLCDIRSMLYQASRVQVRHIFREANSAADWVAARVAHHSGFWSWSLGEDCPLVLSQILYSDMVGLTHARIV